MPRATVTAVGAPRQRCACSSRRPGRPLWTAISFGYTAAVEALAGRGARLDNLCFAAALGDLDAVRGYFDSDGALRDDVAPVERIGTHGPELATDRIIEYALIWAAAHDRRQVVEYLLTKNPDLRVREPCFDATALGVARYFEHHELVGLLERASSHRSASTEGAARVPPAP